VADLFWLSDQQWTVIAPFMPKDQLGPERKDDRQMVSGILYLSPYSPEFNPIEQAFDKLKAVLRSAAARTLSHLWAAIRKTFIRFSPEKCRNDFTAVGYEDGTCASN
jgi:transposase